MTAAGLQSLTDCIVGPTVVEEGRLHPGSLTEGTAAAVEAGEAVAAVVAAAAAAGAAGDAAATGCSESRFRSTDRRASSRCEPSDCYPTRSPGAG